MTIEAKVIADSISPAGARITTFELRYPRVIHAEFMTHRMFSRNASSSRAIPWEKMKQWVMEDPYVPIHWGKNQRGMQATEELDETAQAWAVNMWLMARDNAVKTADRLSQGGIHKQLVNRLIEPFGHINVVCTATDYANFFSLRVHKMAMPEIQCLAVRMARAYRDSIPIRREIGSWHLPYVEEVERGLHDTDTLVMLSTARCARLSYKTFEGKVPTLDEDRVLCDRLLASDPKHATPAEHQARPFPERGLRSGNFVGWEQHRKRVQGECAPPDFDWQARLIQYEGVDYIV